MIWAALKASPFAETVTYAPASEAPVSLTAIFTDGTQMGSEYPGTFGVLEIAAVDVDFTPAVRDAVTVRSVPCAVIDVQLDGGGIYRLTLNRRS